MLFRSGSSMGRPAVLSLSGVLLTFLGLCSSSGGTGPHPHRRSIHRGDRVKLFRDCLVAEGFFLCHGGSTAEGVGGKGVGSREERDRERDVLRYRDRDRGGG